MVNLVHAAGHCISYDQVRRIDTSVAKTTIICRQWQCVSSSKHRTNQILSVSADNIDIIEETLDGKGIFHATQMVAFQRGITREVTLDLNIGKKEIRCTRFFSYTYSSPTSAGEIQADICKSSEYKLV